MSDFTLKSSVAVKYCISENHLLKFPQYYLTAILVVNPIVVFKIAENQS